MDEYNDTLDADDQITMEERIAATIFSQGAYENDAPLAKPVALDEEQCAELGRTILKMVLAEFRPDLFGN